MPTLGGAGGVAGEIAVAAGGLAVAGAIVGDAVPVGVGVLTVDGVAVPVVVPVGLTEALLDAAAVAVAPAVVGVLVATRIAVGVVIKDVKAALIGTGLLAIFLAIYYVFYHKRNN